MSLTHGGHLTHGSKVNFSGKYFDAVQYGVDAKSGLIDYEQVQSLADEHQPRLVIAGFSAYSRVIDWERFRNIADSVGAYFMVDMAHVAGLVAAGQYPNPLPYADVVTTTTHKTLRGPRGGMILSSEEYARPLDRAIFPGLQGGPHNHTTAAIAVALAEANTEAFREYAAQIVKNAQALAEALLKDGFELISGGTDNHLILIDTTQGTADRPSIAGKPAAQTLERAGIVCNYNTVPFDPRKPFDPSGIRIGTPAATSCGMKEAEMGKIADWMQRALVRPDDEASLEQIRGEVTEMRKGFPAPGITV
jgi:glycine hydroxymethyltransferase